MRVNPEPIGEHPIQKYPLYPEGENCFIYPTTVRVEVEALRVECACGELVTGRPDTVDGRHRLLEFARKHAESCGFPDGEVLVRLP